MTRNFLGSLSKPTGVLSKNGAQQFLADYGFYSKKINRKSKKLAWPWRPISRFWCLWSMLWAWFHLSWRLILVSKGRVVGYSLRNKKPWNSNIIFRGISASMPILALWNSDQQSTLGGVKKEIKTFLICKKSFKFHLINPYFREWNGLIDFPIPSIILFRIFFIKVKFLEFGSWLCSNDWSKNDRCKFDMYESTLLTVSIHSLEIYGGSTSSMIKFCRKPWSASVMRLFVSLLFTFRYHRKQPNQN